MRIRVLSIGKTNMPFVKEGLSVYNKRIAHLSKFEWIELPDVKNSGKLDELHLKKLEGQSILKALQDSEQLIILDERGKPLTSVELSAYIQDKMNYFSGDLCFVIGGAYGFSDEVYAAAAGKLSLSKMTFSHQLIRLIFSEQLYRALAIIKNVPYHHA